MGGDVTIWLISVALLWAVVFYKKFKVDPLEWVVWLMAGFSLSIASGIALLIVHFALKFW